MSPREVLEKHTSLELQYWQAWHKLEDMEHQQQEQKAAVKSQVNRG